MATTTQIRQGAYYDSVVLMQLQRALAALPGVEEAGVVMATNANKELLAQSDLAADELQNASAEDLVIAVRSARREDAEAAIAQVDALLVRKRSLDGAVYLPKTLEAARTALPEARWALVSTPGRYAAAVARDALNLGLNVFLYSDNVTLDDEVRLKQEAARRGLLVMGADCGTAIVNGVGLGFANRVQRGAIGVIGASGTGLQHVSSRIDALGSGITHALGTGGRDLSDAVGAITTLQTLDLLRRDPATRVIVIISKPPSPTVAARILEAARRCGKPVVVNFIGYPMPAATPANIHFAPTLDATAALAVELESADNAPASGDERPRAGYLRGLFSGGTLAYEAQLILRHLLPQVWSNAPLEKTMRLENALTSKGHTILDLGEDEFTVGRLHPMLDNDLRIKRLLQEAADAQTGALLLDVVLGDGAHPDPASELAPAIQRARALAAEAGRDLPVVVVLVGTASDPQGKQAQRERLEAAGAQVFARNDEAVRAAAGYVVDGTADLTPDPSPTGEGGDANPEPDASAGVEGEAAVSLDVLHDALAAINVGLESFAESLTAQGASVMHVDWKPPAGGNEKLMGILARMKKK